MSEVKEICLAIGTCTGCGGCAEMQPEYIGWKEGESRPFLINDVATEDIVHELRAFCPEDCFD